MWDPLVRYGLSAEASLTTVNKRVNDLRVAMRTFTGDGNKATIYPNWKCILRHISYAWVVMVDLVMRVRHSFVPCR